MQQRSKVQFLVETILCFPKQGLQRLLVRCVTEEWSQIQAENLPTANSNIVEAIWVTLVMQILFDGHAAVRDGFPQVSECSGLV
jgi:hypothetical protein